MLLDVHVGSERGPDLIDDVAGLEPPTQIVLLSGSGEISPELRVQVAGVLAKPFDLAELSAAVGLVRVG
jgi:FixJ family two-component response regulator